METLEFWVMINDPLPFPGYMEGLRQILEPFEQEYGVEVQLRGVPWKEGWVELVRAGLYGRGPDVSEVGTTWVSSLAGMKGLHRFTDEEVEWVVGKRENFLPQSWKSTEVLGEPGVWAIPWLVGYSLLYFRRDWLEQAGCDLETAFSSHDALVQTLECLQAWDRGVGRAIWVVPTHRTLNTLHYVACWIWGNGGAFLSSDGRRALFAEPEALEGIVRYFSLRRFLPSSPLQLSDDRAMELLLGGDAAVAIGGCWTLRVYSHRMREGMRERLGLAQLPGSPFLGGSNLVLLEHSPRKELALELIRYLTSRQVVTNWAWHIGLWPARIAALDEPIFRDNPLYALVTEGLSLGRAFPSHLMWGLIEHKLSEVLAEIWREILTRRSVDVREVVERRIVPLAEEIDRVLNPSF